MLESMIEKWSNQDEYETVSYIHTHVTDVSIGHVRTDATQKYSGPHCIGTQTSVAMELESRAN